MYSETTDHVLVLRTCAADMTGHGGFIWPASGPVEAPDWDPEPRCGAGLHGLLWGEGDGSLLSRSPDAKWLAVRVKARTIVDLGGKVKFPRGEVVCCGERDEVTRYLLAHGAHGRAVAGGTATAGDRGTATAGYLGTATAGYLGTATAGDRGTATAGDRGTATAGDLGTATAGYLGTATAGDRGTATAGDRGTATAGYLGTATAGCRGTATAGKGGVIVLRWWDDAASRWRVAVGETRVDQHALGLLAPNVPHHVVDGRIVPKEAVTCTA